MRALVLVYILLPLVLVWASPVRALDVSAAVPTPVPLPIDPVDITVPLPANLTLDLGDLAGNASVPAVEIVGDLPNATGADDPAVSDPEGVLVPPPAPQGLLPPPLPEAAIQTGGGVALAIYASDGFRGIDLGRLRQLPAIAPLFSRIRRERILDHPMRQQIYAQIRAREGIHYRELLRSLGVSNGTLAFHLDHMERAGLVRSLRVRGRRLLYATGPAPSAEDVLISGRQRRILGVIRERPGATGPEIRRALGFGRSSLGYHLRVLRALGLVESRRTDRRVRYFARSL